MTTAGLAKSTVEKTSDSLKQLNKLCDLTQPEQVKTIIAFMKTENSTKQNHVKAYNYFAETNGIQWERPKYKYERKIPLIPTRDNINKIMSASSKKYATIFTILTETGLEGHELATINRKDIDQEQRIINAQGCKGHLSRSFKLKQQKC